MKKLAAWVLLCFIVTARPIATIDGDTLDARLDVWLGLTATERIRVLGVDTPELKGKGARETADAASARITAAKAAKQFTEQWLAKGPVQIQACKRDAFGRILGRVNRGGDYLDELLIVNGLGVPYEK